MYTKAKFIIAIFLSVLFISYLSCKKQDQKEQFGLDVNDNYEKFFKSNVISSSILRVQTSLKNDIRSKSIVADLIRDYGFAIWDKSKIYYRSGANNRGVVSTTQDTIVRIPLVKPNSNEVKSFLEAILRDTIVINLHKENEYQHLAFSNADSAIRSAEQFALKFMHLNKSVFNHERFKILDSKLFNRATNSRGSNDGSLERFIEIKDTTLSNQRMSCVTSFYWQRHCNWGSSTCKKECDNCVEFCVTWMTWTDCTIDDGGSGGSPSLPTNGGTPIIPSGTTGGGGSGNNPTNGTPILGTGWIPVEEVEPVQIIKVLTSKLGLTEIEVEWLKKLENVEYTHTIYDELKEDDFSEASITTAKIIIEQGVNNLIDAPWGDDFEDIIRIRLGIYNTCCPGLTYLSISNAWSKKIRADYALARHENPNWSKVKCYWEAMQESVHVSLDIAGLVPVFGEVFDITHGVIYTIQGDALNATLSYSAGLLPIGGQLITTSKYYTRVITALDGTRRTLKTFKQINNFINFGDRRLLRKVLGLAKGDPRVAHHIIPWSLFNNTAVQKASSNVDGFHLNELFNGIPLNPAVHTGSHTIYTNNVRNKLSLIPTNLSAEATKIEIERIISNIRRAIINQPNTHIDNLIF